ncbi:MAG: HD domain-containing protein [Candidatus Methanosuratincola petrocarbonis]
MQVASPSQSGGLERDISLYKMLAPSLEAVCRGHFSEIGCHGWEHVQRVRALSRRIGVEEGAALEILDLAALFHDLKRGEDDHARRSAEFAEQILRSEGFSEGFSKAVGDAIASHSYTCGRTPQSIEAKVLSDADRLDAMGAIGIYRTVQYNLEKGYPAARVAEHISEKLLHLSEGMHTATGRRMAKQREAILGLYMESLLSELRDSSSST